MPLTDTAIRKAKGRDKQYKIAHAGGLYLLVTPDGAKCRRLKYRHAGNEKLLAFGVYPQVTLADARAGRDDAKCLLKQGTDPVIFRKQQRYMAEVASAHTFEIVARQWHEKQKHQWKPGHAASGIESLDTNVFQDLGDRPIREITAPDLLATMRKVEKRGALDVAQQGPAALRCRVSLRHRVRLSGRNRSRRRRDTDPQQGCMMTRHLTSPRR